MKHIVVELADQIGTEIERMHRYGSHMTRKGQVGAGRRRRGQMQSGQAPNGVPRQVEAFEMRQHEQVARHGCQLVVGQVNATQTTQMLRFEQTRLDCIDRIGAEVKMFEFFERAKPAIQRTQKVVVQDERSKALQCLDIL